MRLKPPGCSCQQMRERKEARALCPLSARPWIGQSRDEIELPKQLPQVIPRAQTENPATRIRDGEVRTVVEWTIPANILIDE